MAKVTQAQIRATKNFEDKAYFKSLVRFPVALEEDIRAAAEADGRSLNNFIVSATCRMAGLPEPKLKEPGNTKTTRPKKLHEGNTTRGSAEKLHDPKRNNLILHDLYY